MFVPRSLLCCVLLLLGIAPLLGQNQAFPCDGAFYLSTSNSRTKPTALLRLKYDSPSQSIKWDTLLLNTTRQLDPIGFRVVDGYIYGLDQSTMELVRVDASGTVTVLADMSTRLDPKYEYRAGAITPRGKYFIIFGRDPQDQFDKELFRIRLDRSDFNTGRTSLLNSNGDFRVEDLVYDPHYGALYGFDEVSHKLLTIFTFSGLVTSFNSKTTKEFSRIGALFFNQAGQLFGYGSKNGTGDDTFLRMDALRGDVLPILSDRRSIITDGCSCPYTVELDKVIKPNYALPCQTVSITYYIRNRLGATYLDKKFRDTLPPELLIAEVLYQPQTSTLLSGPGGHILAIDFDDFLLGEDSVVIRVQVPANDMGEFASQAIIDSLYATQQFMARSNDPTTPEAFDPTRLQVGPLSAELGEDLSLCFGDSGLIFPSLNVPADSLFFTWSDGSMGRSLQVKQGGLYWVQVAAACQLVMDSVFVQQPDEAVQVSLNGPTDIQQGQQVQLSFTTNAIQPYSLNWSAQPEAYFDCTDCPNPLTKPLVNTQISLELTDHNGCVGTGQWSIAVDTVRSLTFPNVFSPNLDGINDRFFPFGVGRIRLIRFAVFDRWGRELYLVEGASINDPDYGWDGRSGGREQVPGTYYWAAHVAYPDESQAQLRGSVLLLR